MLRRLCQGSAQQNRPDWGRCADQKIDFLALGGEIVGRNRLGIKADLSESGFWFGNAILRAVFRASAGRKVYKSDSAPRGKPGSPAIQLQNFQLWGSPFFVPNRKKSYLRSQYGKSRLPAGSAGAAKATPPTINSCAGLRRPKAEAGGRAE